MRSSRSHLLAPSTSRRRTPAAHSGRRPTMVALVATLVLLSGCKTPDFVGRRYSNFTAYYNTFYNAERQFEKGYENLDRFEDKVDREQYLPLFVKTTGTSASREFEQTILKSADILREHPESKWVDDALMLIGKSYFYQENYVGAVQKFSEILDQQTDLRDEAQFWLARSLMTSGAYSEALEVLTLAMATEGADAQWIAQDRLLLAELAIRQEQWEDAAGHLEAGLASVKDKELAARASFLLGQVHETLGNYERAYAAYADVPSYRAPYELEYAAEYSAVRIDGLYLNPERALRDVRRLERDDKNLVKTAELRYLRARILYVAGEADEAVLTFDELLYDPLSLPPGASIGELRGRIHYALAELYRDVDRDFLMAAAHFDTAAAALGGGSGGRNARRSGALAEMAPAPEAIQDASRLKDSFSRFARVYKDVARYDSLLFLGSLPQEEYDARILELRKKRAEELEEQRRLMQQRQRDQAFRESAGQSGMNMNRGLPEGKVIPTADDPTGLASGYLQHEDPIRVQEGRMQFQNVWGNRPLVPNWRRSAAMNAADVQVSEESLAEQEALLLEMEQNELPDIDDSAVPRDSTGQVEMKAARAIARYEVGNILFLGMARPDSAAVWYRTVIEEDATETVASRAQFALAEVQRALGDSLSARRLYTDLLSRFPDSDFIPSVQDRLGLEVAERAVSDSSALALEALERALRIPAGQGAHDLDSLLTVASQWQGFPPASRALFAVASRHLEAAAGDSAEVFSPLNQSVSTDVLASLWPDKYAVPAPADSVSTVDASLAQSSDSLRVSSPELSDSLRATLSDLPDSLRLSSAQLPDSLRAPVDDGSPPQAEQDDPVSNAAAANGVRAVTSDVPAPPSTPPPPTVLGVEDVLGKVASWEARKALGLRAQAMLDALESWRTPVVVPVDSTLADSLLLDPTPSEPAMQDSTGGTPVDRALPAVAVADEPVPTGSTPSKEQDAAVQTPPAATPQAAMADSLVMALVARSAARQDSLRALREREDSRQARAQVSEEEDEDERNVRATTNIKPLTADGQFDTEAVGYTFTFGGHPTLTSAQEQQRVLDVQLAESGYDVFILTNAVGEPLEYLVGWGLFFSRGERDAAETEFSAILPETRNILHLLPAE